MKEIRPDDNALSIIFDDEFYLSRTVSIYKVRKTETPTQAGTSWGHIGSYLLCCESKRTRKRLQREMAGGTSIEILSEEDVPATIKDKKADNLKEDLSLSVKEAKRNKSKQGKKLKQSKINLDGKYNNYKFGVGDRVRKKFGDGWFDGTIVVLGVEGAKNTYEVVYEDNDWERLEEEAIEKIVTHRRKSL